MFVFSITEFVLSSVISMILFSIVVILISKLMIDARISMIVRNNNSTPNKRVRFGTVN
jgi:hypothetical protein